jgi:formylmethanofuran dehydrogenase subunit E
MEARSWQRCVDFHGHSCPGLAIGFKAVEALEQQMGLVCGGDEELVCVTENDACGVDAVQVLTGCSLGKGNLLYRERGKMAFSFFNRTTGQNLRMVFKLPVSRKDVGREELQQMILDADPATLFHFSQPGFSLPEKARIFDSLTCEQCGESAVEHLIRLHEGKKLCLDCFERYSRGW